MAKEIKFICECYLLNGVRYKTGSVHTLSEKLAEEAIMNGYGYELTNQKPLPSELPVEFEGKEDLPNLETKEDKQPKRRKTK